MKECFWMSLVGGSKRFSLRSEPKERTTVVPSTDSLAVTSGSPWSMYAVYCSKTREVDRKDETPAAEIQGVNGRQVVIMTEQARRGSQRGVLVRDTR
jgi:hypothetical protein